MERDSGIESDLPEEFEALPDATDHGERVTDGQDTPAVDPVDINAPAEVRANISIGQTGDINEPEVAR